MHCKSLWIKASAKCKSSLMCLVVIFVTFRSVFVSDERDEVKRKSVKEGESVTLDPGDVKKPNEIKIMIWYYNDTRIAEITGDLRHICTDVQCEDGNERFRDRLKLDNQTGSLTITSTRTEHTGLYKLEIISRRFRIMRSFTVDVTGEYHFAI